MESTQLAVKLLKRALPSNSLSRRGNSARNQSLPTNAPTSALSVSTLSVHFLAFPGSTSAECSSLKMKSCFRQKMLRNQYMNCQSGYIMLFSPVLGSTAQFVHPLAQTNFFASRCVHSKSCAAASCRISTVAGAFPTRRDGIRERDRYEGSDFKIGSRRRRVKLI